jgi:chorismate mutase/prephenate dehydratase
MKVAYQGEPGAYSEEAVYSFFKTSIIVKPCKTLFDTFEAATKRLVDYSVVPVENSLEGSVNETYDLLLESNLKIFGEINLRVKHALIAKPETSIKQVERVYSHPQALAQCRNYLRNLGVKPIPTYDTAGSVKIIKQRKSNKIAAIASSRAASIYKMNILDNGIEDNLNNFTRFFVLSYIDIPSIEKNKTSIVFSAKHIPGALYHALRVFAERNINLTKIESRPTRKALWEYNFYLDFEGNQEDENCKDALTFLNKKGMLIKILGSYPKANSE